VGDTCGYDDPQLNALVQDVREVQDGTKEHQKAWYALDDYIVNNALELYIMWTPVVDAWSKKLGNVTFRPDAFGVPLLDPAVVTIKKSK
jgi:hypothetical protein